MCLESAIYRQSIEHAFCVHKIQIPSFKGNPKRESRQLKVVIPVSQNFKLKDKIKLVNQSELREKNMGVSGQ